MTCAIDCSQHVRRRDGHWVVGGIWHGGAALDVDQGAPQCAEYLPARQRRRRGPSRIICCRCATSAADYFCDQTVKPFVEPGEHASSLWVTFESAAQMDCSLVSASWRWLSTVRSSTCRQHGSKSCSGLTGRSPRSLMYNVKSPSLFETGFWYSHRCKAEEQLEVRLSAVS